MFPDKQFYHVFKTFFIDIPVAYQLKVPTQKYMFH